MKDCSIYALCDPSTGECRYVGKTIDLEDRFRKHLRDKHLSHKQCWIVGLKKTGRIPVLTVLQTVKGDGCAEEIRWIQYYRERGADLTNLTDGGEGVAGYKLTKKDRLNMRMAHLGKKLSPAHVEGMRKAYALLERTDRQKAQLLELNKRKVGVARPNSLRVLLREKCSGWFHDGKAKASMSAKRRGVPRNPEGVRVAVATRETHRNGYDAFIEGKPIRPHTNKFRGFAMLTVAKTGTEP